MKTIKLGALVAITGGGTPDRSNPAFWGGKIPWATVKDFKTLEISSTTEHITEEGLQGSAANVAPTGSIILPTRMALGKAAINTVPVAINQDLKALRVNDPKVVDRDYLFRFLLSKATYLESQGQGATVKGITLSVLRDLEVPVPPIHEQQRIATILDKADRLRRRRQESIRLADDFVDSLFFTTFGDVDANSHGWDVVRLEDLALQVTDGEHQTPRRSDDGIKLLSARNVQNGFLALADVDYVPAEEFERIRRRCAPQRGDVLISCSGTIGRVASVSTDEPMALVRSVALVRPDTRHVLTSFLEHYLRSASMQRRMVAASKSSAQANLFQGPIRALPVLLPPMSLQVEFERRLLSLKSWSRKAADSAEMILDLGKSLHGKYFGSGATL